MTQSSTKALCRKAALNRSLLQNASVGLLRKPPSASVSSGGEKLSSGETQQNKMPFNKFLIFSEYDLLMSLEITLCYG
jgi:hypothetical protein